MSKDITLQIDNKQIKGKNGETILEAALNNGIEIPNLCYSKKVSHTAACRLCVVKIDGLPISELFTQHSQSLAEEKALTIIRAVNN